MSMSPRQELLLAFLAAGPEAMDPIRIVKGMFIFGQEAPRAWLRGAPMYTFAPYNWGPFSSDIYRDLDALRHAGLVDAIDQVGASWKYHRATDAGRAEAARVAPKWMPDVIRFLGEVRAYTLRHGFQELLKAVYKKYPEYAVNSVFRY